MKKSVESYLEKGRAYRAAGNYEEARRTFAKAIKTDPSNAQAYYERGKTRDGGDDYYDDALDDLYKALELNPNLTDVYLEIVCNDALLGLYPDEEGNEMMTKYVEGRPNDPMAYIERAWGYFMTCHYEKAIEDYTKAIKLFSEDCDNDIFFMRGCSYAKMKNFDLALHDFNKAICIKPDEPEYYFERGVLYENFQNINLAIADYKIALQAFNDKKAAGHKVKRHSCLTSRSIATDIYFALGSCYFMQKKYREAINKFDLIEETEHIGQTLFALKAYSYKNLGEHQKAIQNFNQAIMRRDGLFSYYFLNRGESYWALGDIGKRDRDHKAAEFLLHLEETAPEKIKKLTYDCSTETIIFDDAA